MSHAITRPDCVWDKGLADKPVGTQVNGALYRIDFKLEGNRAPNHTLRLLTRQRRMETAFEMMVKEEMVSPRTGGQSANEFQSEEIYINYFILTSKGTVALTGQRPPDRSSLIKRGRTEPESRLPTDGPIISDHDN